jgi:hypothetical protein
VNQRSSGVLPQVSNTGFTRSRRLKRRQASRTHRQVRGDRRPGVHLHRQFVAGAAGRAAAALRERQGLSAPAEYGPSASAPRELHESLLQSLRFPQGGERRPWLALHTLDDFVHCALRSSASSSVRRSDLSFAMSRPPHCPELPRRVRHFG